MASQEMTLPCYIEYGGRVTAPAEFDCRGGHFRGFVLEADKDKLTGQINRMFNKICGEGMSFRVLTKYVVMLVGWFDEVQAIRPPWDEMGIVYEEQLSIWVPVALGRDEGNEFVAERLMTAVPFIWVDNPMSYVGGRENYGFPKSLGRFEFADGVDGEIHLSTYGGPFGRTNKAKWLPLITMKPSGSGGREEGTTGEEELDGEEAFITALTEGNLDPHQETILPGGLRIVENAIRDALAGKSHQIFLKQFRDAHEPGYACYQELITAPITLRNTKAKIRPWQKWDVEITDFSSHPICGDLGVIPSQTTHKTYAINMEFECGLGSPVTPD